MIRIKRALLILGISIQAFLLVGCSDTELVGFLFGSWLSETQIVQGDSINWEALANEIAEDRKKILTNDQEAVSLAGFEVIGSLEKADELAEEGAAQQDLEKINQAIDQRPQDWSYVEKLGAVKMALGDSNDANNEFENADTLVINNSHSYTGCITNRTNQLRHRISALSEQLNISVSTPGVNPAEVQKALEDTQKELDTIQETGKTDFCFNAFGSP